MEAGNGLPPHQLRGRAFILKLEVDYNNSLPELPFLPIQGNQMNNN